MKQQMKEEGSHWRATVTWIVILFLLAILIVLAVASQTKVNQI